MIIQEQTQLMQKNSNTTFVKVKCGDYPHPRHLVLNSNTTFVKVKFNYY